MLTQLGFIETSINSGISDDSLSDFDCYRRKNLENYTHKWIKDIVFFCGASWYKNHSEVRTIDEISDQLQLRWLYRYTRVTIAIELKRPLHWLREWSIGGRDPFLFDMFSRDYRLNKTDIELVEGIVKSYLPGISVVTCYICGNRFQNTLTSEGWCCDSCQSDFLNNPKNKLGFVYVFGSVTDGFYKIGCSDVPVLRMKDFQRSKLPFPVEMIHSIPVDNKVQAEAELHRLYREKRTNGEWFRLNQDDIKKIKSIKKYVSGKWITLP